MLVKFELVSELAAVHEQLHGHGSMRSGINRVHVKSTEQGVHHWLGVGFNDNNCLAIVAGQLELNAWIKPAIEGVQYLRSMDPGAVALEDESVLSDVAVFHARVQ